MHSARRLTGMSLSLLQRSISSASTNFSIYVSTSQNPFFNIAFEQWLFNSTRNDRILYLWRNGPSVIIGRFQGAWKECKVNDMEREGVNLVRRASGGGAVYQDLGNSIFTFISPRHDTKSIAENNKIIVDALEAIGVNGSPTGRNDIEVNGQKISGAAFRHTKDRSLHHGTLLLDLDMSALERYLTPNKLKMESKGVSSVAARVINLKKIVPDITHDRVCAELQKSFLKSHNIKECPIIYVDESFAKNNSEILKLMGNLQDWEWRFGKEPEFSHRLETRFAWGMIDIYLVVKSSTIEKVTLYSDALDVELIASTQNALSGAPYSAVGIQQALSTARKSLTNPASINNLDEFQAWILNNMS